MTPAPARVESASMINARERPRPGARMAVNLDVVRLINGPDHVPTECPGTTAERIISTGAAEAAALTACNTTTCARDAPCRSMTSRMFSKIDVFFLFITQYTDTQASGIKIPLLRRTWVGSGLDAGHGAPQRGSTSNVVRSPYFFHRSPPFSSSLLSPPKTYSSLLSRI